MKRFVMFVAAGLAFFTLKAQTAGDLVKFETETHDFGKIKQGVPVKYDFVFKNISKAPVTIETAQASCGCTTPEWPKAPVLPGKADKINAGFNAAAAGRFEKTITVKLQGVEGAVVLKIMGDVVSGEGAVEPATQFVQSPSDSKPAVVATPVKAAAPAKTAITKASTKRAAAAKKPASK